MTFIWFLLFASVVSITGGILQAIHNEKKQNSASDKNRYKHDIKSITTKKGYQRVNINNFIKTYRANIPVELFVEINIKKTEGFKYVDIPTDIFSEIKNKKAEYDEFNRKIYQTSELNNKGIFYEKNGEIKQAINTYEKNIELGGMASHSYTRLMVLYRKNRDYDNEIRIIKRAIDVFSKDSRYNNDVEKWIERLKKIEQR